MRITNVVCSASLGCSINLSHLCRRLANARYDPRRFSGLIWHHKKIGGNCLVFSNGNINCNGKAETFQDGIKRLRRYARSLQKLGYTVRLTDAKVLTVSACHDLGSHLDLSTLSRDRRLVYEPELFPTVVFKVLGITFSCFHNGKVIVTGIKIETDIRDVVYPTLVELRLYTRTT